MCAVYSEWLLGDDYPLTSEGRMKKATVDELTRWMCGAWMALSEFMVMKAPGKCEISNSLDGSKDCCL